MNLKKIPKKVRDVILYGDENIEYKNLKDFEGIINFIDRKYTETERWWVQYELEKYLSERDCEVCNGHVARCTSCNQSGGTIQD